MVVLDDEDHVKAGQNGGHKVDVVLPLGVVPAAKHRVGGGEHRAARVQGGGDSSLGVLEKVLVWVSEQQQRQRYHHTKENKGESAL